MKNTSANNNGRPNPVEDGLTHINIYSRSNDHLGRMLSHFYYSPFNHPVFGPFNCMEGLWHWVKSQERDDKLRGMTGWKAKEHGKLMTKRYLKNFQEIIMAANFYKIEQNPLLKELMINSNLPFEHYYIHGPAKLVIMPDSCEWLIKGFEQIRTLLKEGKRPPEVDYSGALN